MLLSVRCRIHEPQAFRGALPDLPHDRVEQVAGRVCVDAEILADRKRLVRSRMAQMHPRRAIGVPGIALGSVDALKEALRHTFAIAEPAPMVVEVAFDDRHAATSQAAS
jgi:hypothetical protein